MCIRDSSKHGAKNLTPKPRSAKKVKQGGSPPLHRLIYQDLLSEIERKVYKPGDRLPSEAQLCERFQASRITVARAMETLQRQHLITRRPGSGTYVEAPPQEAALQFGLLIPELGSTEIFGPICRGMVTSAMGRSHSLSWGSFELGGDESVEAAEQLCQQYIAQRAAGVFFAPMEHRPDNMAVNCRILSALRTAKMPIVLLDRAIAPFPDHDALDCVSIDHYAAGYVLTRHLLEQGARRVIFVARPFTASSVDARFGGCRRALEQLGPQYGDVQEGVLRRLQAGEIAELSAILDECRPDALLCANDATAAATMLMLQSLGLRIPDDIRMVGVDDVRYAKFLPVPLTTLRQNCAEIGAAAMATMLDRIENPNRPARNVQVDFELVVRASCGAGLSTGKKPDPVLAPEQPRQLGHR